MWILSDGNGLPIAALLLALYTGNLAFELVIIIPPDMHQGGEINRYAFFASPHICSRHNSSKECCRFTTSHQQQ